MIGRLNKTILVSVGLLTTIGLLSLWQAAPPRDLSGASITQSIFLRQVTFVAAGLAVLGLATLPHYRNYRRVAFLVHLACAATLMALLVTGRYTKGTRGWFAMGTFRIQPAEFMKVALVLALARSFMYGKDLQRWRGLAWPGLLVALPTALVLLQPDLGTAILFIPTFLAMAFAAGARKRHLATIVLTLLVAAPVAYLTVLKPYQRDRLIAFLSPEKVSPDLVYQRRQALKAVASGQILGRGLGESGSPLPFYIPDRHTDFVFSIIAGEMGLVGASFVLMLFGVLFYQALRLSFQTREPFGRLALVGLTTCLSVQTALNLGVTLGVAPITGVTLPFVSYGGSSYVTSALAVGIVLNVGARWQPAFSSRDMTGSSVEIHDFEPRPVKWLDP